MSSIPPSMERDRATWAETERMRCWNCGAEHIPSLFCPACDTIQQLPEQADYFQVLDVPRRLRLNHESLQQRYYELHRRLHPDLYQSGPQAARQASLRNTAALNRAYRTLRDPIDRGLYWLTLHGESLGANNNQVPPDLAALVFELQEQLEELRAARHTNGHERLISEIGVARTALRERQEALLERLDANFARWDRREDDPSVLIRELKTVLSALAYLGTLMRDVDQELEA